MSERDFGSAVAYFDRALELQPANGDIGTYRVIALLLDGQEEAARESARALWQGPARPRDPELWDWLEERMGAPLREDVDSRPATIEQR